MQDKDTVRLLIGPVSFVLGAIVVFLIFLVTVNVMSTSTNTDLMKNANSIAGTAIAMIGTLLGFVTGQASGAAGKEKAEDRAADAKAKEAQAKQALGVLQGMAPDMAEKARQAHQELYQGL